MQCFYLWFCCGVFLEHACLWSILITEHWPWNMHGPHSCRLGYWVEEFSHLVCLPMGRWEWVESQMTTCVVFFLHGDHQRGEAINLSHVNWEPQMPVWNHLTRSLTAHLNPSWNLLVLQWQLPWSCHGTAHQDALAFYSSQLIKEEWCGLWLVYRCTCSEENIHYSVQHW